MTDTLATGKYESRWWFGALAVIKATGADTNGTLSVWGMFAQVAAANHCELLA